jgi:hypothetical protein
MHKLNAHGVGLSREATTCVSPLWLQTQYNAPIDPVGETGGKRCSRPLFNDCDLSKLLYFPNQVLFMIL